MRFGLSDRTRRRKKKKTIESSSRHTKQTRTIRRPPKSREPTSIQWMCSQRYALTWCLSTQRAMADDKYVVKGVLTIIEQAMPTRLLYVRGHVVVFSRCQPRTFFLGWPLLNRHCCTMERERVTAVALARLCVCVCVWYITSSTFVGSL